MTFNYKWTRKKNANYAIQKKDALGKDAGKEIEIEKKQSSETHYFFVIDYKDRISEGNILRINAILKTITFEYVYKETGEKSVRQYLTKDDLDEVLQNIEKYRNKTIRIEITKPKKTPPEIIKEKRHLSQDMKENLIKRFGEKTTDIILNLVLERFDKEKSIKQKKQEVKEKIKKLKDELALYETETNAEIIKLEKELCVLIGKGKKIYNEDAFNEFIKNAEFQTLLLDLHYHAAKPDRQIKAGNKRQMEYRERKNAETGKPKRKVGRPRKNGL